jgi:phage terminase Nu1 subunit (DNA packaging protein)
VILDPALKAIIGMSLLTILSWVAVVWILVREHKSQRAFDLAVIDRFMAKNYQEIAMASSLRDGGGSFIPQPDDEVRKADRAALQKVLSEAEREAQSPEE